jgi:RimJ/RimL family protein N-acetyltransferase
VLAQYLVFTNPEAPPVGIVTAYEANPGDGHAKIAAARFHDSESSPVMIVAVGLLVRHLFASFNLRKLYMDVPEYNLVQFDALIGRYFVEEACLVDHIYFGNQYWDQVTLALYRDKWAEVEQHVLPDA